MEKVDRLGWTVGFTASSFGVKVGVRTNRADLLPRMMEYLPPGSRIVKNSFVDLLYSLRVADAPRRKGMRTFHLLYEEFVQIGRTEDLEELLGNFGQSVEYFVPQMAPRLLFVHAGVVGWNNRAILVPGRSLSGKSRMVHALVQSGASYYSDEFAVIDHQGLVYPYARPISFREDRETLQTSVSVQEIGGRIGKRPIPVGAVLSLTY